MVTIGDYVQWDIGGVLQMEEPHRVRMIMGDWVFVDGSDTGIPMTQIIVVEKDENV